MSFKPIPKDVSTTTLDEPRLASASRTCALLDISLSTLDRLVGAGVLEPVRLMPRAHRRFRIADIEALVAEKESADD